MTTPRCIVSLVCTVVLLLSGCGRIRDGFYRLRGDAFRAANNQAEAISWYSRIASNRQDAAVLQALARAYDRLGDRTNLLLTYERIGLQTTNHDDLVSLVCSLLDDEEFLPAIPLIDRLIRLSPDNWQHKELLLATLRKAGRTNELAATLDAMARSMAHDPSNILHLTRLALLYGPPSNAIAQASATLDAMPDELDLRMTLAMLQLEHDDAVAAYSNAVIVAACRHDDPDVYGLLGDAAIELGNATQAVAHYRMALRLNTHEAVILNNLAYLLLRSTSNVAEALEYALSAVQLERKPYTLDTLAYAFYKKRRFDAALRLLDEAETRTMQAGEPLDAEIVFHRGLVLAARGDIDAAEHSFHIALQQQPNLRDELRREPYYALIQPRLTNRHDHVESPR
jgi:Flp pilus assembly protein TadD